MYLHIIPLCQLGHINISPPWLQLRCITLCVFHMILAFLLWDLETEHVRPEWIPLQAISNELTALQLTFRH